MSSSGQYGLGKGLESLIPSSTNPPEPATQDDKKTSGITHISTSEIPAPSLPPKSAPTTTENSELQHIDIEQIVTNPYQPRLTFNKEELQELSESIMEHGVVEPIIVTKTGAGFELIAGERRYQASKIAKKKTIPAIIKKDVTDQEKLELAVIENVQRSDLNPIEKAKAYQIFADEFGLTQEQIGKKVGKSRVVVTNALALLTLPVEIQHGIEKRAITEGHARAILSIKNPEQQRVAYKRVIAKQLSVRATESLVKSLKSPKQKPVTNTFFDADITDAVHTISESLEIDAKVVPKKRGGMIMIPYATKNELERITKHIANSESAN